VADRPKRGTNLLVGVLGIEPSLSAPKADVLPVYDTPSSRLAYLRIRSDGMLRYAAAPLEKTVLGASERQTFLRACDSVFS
jgi:hypothetical protein